MSAFTPRPPAEAPPPDRRASNSRRASTASSKRTSVSSATSDAPAHRVRFHSSKSLVTVKKLPHRDAADAWESRKGIWEPAPEDDFFWDGEERCFRERELTADELAEVLKSRRKKKGLSLGSLFGRPNYKARARRMIAEQGTYEDPLDLFDQQTGDGGGEEGDTEDSDEEDSQTLRELHAPPSLDVMPSKSAFRQARRSTKKPKRESKKTSFKPRKSLSLPRAASLTRPRGISMHRDSVFSLRRRRFVRELTDDEIMLVIISLIGVICLLLGVAIALVKSVTTAATVTVPLFAVSAALTPPVLQRLPDHIALEIRQLLAEFTVLAE